MIPFHTLKNPPAPRFDTIQPSCIFAAMKKFLLLSLALILLGSSAFKFQDDLYRLFNSKGGTTEMKYALKNLERADIVLFGELHNDVIGHHVEMEILKHLHQRHGEDLIIGCEMFEADDQLKMNEFIQGLIPEKTFEDQVRLWKNYESDYKPMVQYAAEHKIPTIATNIPRRYASMVYKGGFEALDSLAQEAYTLMAPLPIAFDTTVECYNNLLASKMPGHGSPNLAKAQAMKDATMAHFILENWEEGKHFYHFNGAYHSNNFEGIVWYLKKAKPNLSIQVVSMIEVDSLQPVPMDKLNMGSYILMTNPDFPKSY